MELEALCLGQVDGRAQRDTYVYASSASWPWTVVLVALGRLFGRLDPTLRFLLKCYNSSGVRCPYTH